jgi:16S rRNA (uracil1498-N3)-methyltransferase
MAQPRFFLPAEAIDTAAGVALLADERLVSQIRRVLRLKPGDAIVVLDGLGHVYRCVLASLGPTAVKAEIIGYEQTAAPAVTIIVGLPLLKGERFEWAIQKLTELGAAQIVPLTSERTVVKRASESRLARWQLIAREAAEQCERPTIPHIVSPVALENVVTGPDTIADIDLALICAERRKAPLLQTLLHSCYQGGAQPKNILVAIGPEGGFSDREVAMAQESGMTAVSLGPRILRAETAAIYALSLLTGWLGESET